MPLRRQITTTTGGSQQNMNRFLSAASLAGTIGGAFNQRSQQQQQAEIQKQQLEMQRERNNIIAASTYLDIANKMQNVSLATSLANKGLSLLGVDDPLAASTFINQPEQRKQAWDDIYALAQNPETSQQDLTFGFLRHSDLLGIPKGELVQSLLTPDQSQQFYNDELMLLNEGVTGTNAQLEELKVSGALEEKDYKAAKSANDLVEKSRKAYLKGEYVTGVKAPLSLEAKQAEIFVGALIARAKGQTLRPSQKKVLGEMDELKEQQIATSKAQEYKNWLTMATKIMPSPNDPKYIDNPDQYKKDILIFADKFQDPAERERIKTETGVDIEDVETEDKPGIFKRVWDAVFNPEKIYKSDKQETTSVDEYEYKQDTATGKWYKRKKK